MPTRESGAMMAARRSLTPLERELIWQRDRGICGICHEPVAFEAMHVDHALALANGGDTTAGNLRATHGRCNLRLNRTGRARGGRPFEGKPRSFRLSDEDMALARQLGQGDATDGLRFALDLVREQQGVALPRRTQKRKGGA